MLAILHRHDHELTGCNYGIDKQHGVLRTGQPDVLESKTRWPLQTRKQTKGAPYKTSKAPLLASSINDLFSHCNPHQLKMPFFPSRNNRGTSSNGGNPPQRQDQPSNGTNRFQQPIQPSNGINGTHQPSQQISSITRGGIARGLVAIRVGERARSITEEERSIIRQRADSFLDRLEGANLLEYFKPAMLRHGRGEWSETEVFRHLITKLAEESHLDIIQQSAELIPRDWEMDHDTSEDGRRIVRIRVPPYNWDTFGAFPRLEDLSD